MLNKKNIAWLLLLFSVSILQAQPKRTLLDKIIANVGDHITLHSDIEEQYNAMSYKPDDARCVILDQLLVQSLLLNQAEIDSVLVPDEEVEAQLDARVGRILEMMGGNLTQFIGYYGKTPNEVKEDFREDMRNQMLVQRMEGQIMSNVTITPNEVKAFFDRIPLDSLPYFNSEVEIGEIVIKPEPNEEALEQTRKRLDEIRTKIVEGGEDFETWAKKVSDDKGSGARGGNLGFAGRGKYVTEFEAEAYRLKKGEISPVFRSPFGYHIIEMLERRGNSVNLRHILMKPLISGSDLQKTRMKLDTIRNLVMTDSINFKTAVYIYSDEDVQSKTNAGGMINPKTGTSIFEVGDLDPEIYFAIDTMKVGDISAPFMYQSRTGEDMFRVLLLKTRTQPHQANLKDDYSKIQSAALEQKKRVFLSDWVAEKVKETYVEVDPSFGKCETMKKWIQDSRKSSDDQPD